MNIGNKKDFTCMVYSRMCRILRGRVIGGRGRKSSPILTIQRSRGRSKKTAYVEEFPRVQSIYFNLCWVNPTTMRGK